MYETVINVLKLVALFMAIGAFSIIGIYVAKLLNSLAVKYNAEKISSRIFDAIEKMKMVTSIVSANAMVKLNNEAIKALADGVVTDKEVSDTLDAVVEDVLKTLHSEIPTLSKYFLGENLKTFIGQLVKKYIVDYAKAKLGVAALPLQK